MLIWEIFSKDNVVKMIVTAIPTLFIALIIPFVSIRFALKQFYSQKWWEKKSGVYSDLIECLTEYEHSSDLLFQHYVTTQESNDEFTTKCSDTRSKAFQEIQKIRLRGHFLFPKSVVAELTVFIRNVEKSDNDPNWLGAIDDQSGYAKVCVSRLIELGHKDLNIK